MSYATKRRYRSVAHPMHRVIMSANYRCKGMLRFQHVLNLFVAYRWEREHPRDIVPTDRYRSWLAKRDGAIE